MNNSDIKHLARANDPLTSINAAENSVKFSGGHKAMILEALKNGMMNVRMIEFQTGLTVVQIDRRMAELKRNGEVEIVMFNGAELIVQGTRVYRLPVCQLELV